MLVFPDERVRYSYCRPCEPLIFEMGLSLAEAFVPTVSPCAGIPFFIQMRPKASTPEDRRSHWPRTMNGKLLMERINGLPKREKLKRAPSFDKLVLEAGSLRIGVQRAILEWIFPKFSLAVTYTIACVDPDKNAVWRIEPSFGGGPPIAQWDTKNDVRQNLLEVVRPTPANHAPA